MAELADYYPPELVFEIRREFAELLRYEADLNQNTDIGQKLRELAAEFEVSGLWVQE